MKYFRILTALFVVSLLIVQALPVKGDNLITHITYLVPVGEEYPGNTTFNATNGQAYPYQWTLISDFVPGSNMLPPANGNDNTWVGNYVNGVTQNNTTVFQMSRNSGISSGATVTNITMTIRMKVNGSAGHNLYIYTSYNGTDYFQTTTSFGSSSIGTTNEIPLFGTNGTANWTSSNLTSDIINNLDVRIYLSSNGASDCYISGMYITVTWLGGAYVSPSIAVNDLFTNANNSLNSVGMGGAGAHLLIGVLGSFLIGVLAVIYVGKKAGIFFALLTFGSLLVAGFFDATTVIVVIILTGLAIWLGVEKMMNARKGANNER